MLNTDITAKGIAYDLYTEGKIQHYNVSAESVRAEIRPNHWVEIDVISDDESTDLIYTTYEGDPCSNLDLIMLSTGGFEVTSEEQAVDKLVKELKLS